MIYTGSILNNNTFSYYTCLLFMGKIGTRKYINYSSEILLLQGHIHCSIRFLNKFLTFLLFSFLFQILTNFFNFMHKIPIFTLSVLITGHFTYPPPLPPSEILNTPLFRTIDLFFFMVRFSKYYPLYIWITEYWFSTR